MLYLNLNDKYPDFPKDSNKGIMLLNKALESDNTAESAMYLLGIVYYIGEVIEQDIPKAEKYLQQASESENDEIREAAKDALERIKNNNQKSNSDGCFITTAVCSSMNKTDNCYELMMFRDFRDHWLRKQPGGDLLIAEYYKTAPQIVKKIDAFVNSMDIYQSIWEKYLKSCLSYLKRKDNEECKNVYMKMLYDLKKEFL